MVEIVNYDRMEITSETMFKLGTKEGVFKSYYARNQFEVLPHKHLTLEEVDQLQERALRTAANQQSQGGGQGFTKCGCQKSCQANNCKCFKAQVLCNSRCHSKQVREGSFKKKNPYLGQCPNRGGSDRIPTSLTDLAK